MMPYTYCPERNKSSPPAQADEAAARSSTVLAHGHTAADALTGGFHQALWVCGLVGLAAVPIALLLVRRDDITPPTAAAEGKTPEPASTS